MLYLIAAAQKEIQRKLAQEEGRLGRPESWPCMVLIISQLPPSIISRTYYYLKVSNLLFSASPPCEDKNFVHLVSPVSVTHRNSVNI